METETLHAALRTEAGKGAARRLRRTGMIPAVAYNSSGTATSLSVSPAELNRLQKSRLGWNHPVSIQIEGADDIPLALLRDVQRHPISRQLLHADFETLGDGDEVVVQVPVEPTGRAQGQEVGGRINLPQRAIALCCQPAAIPVSIKVDVTPLDVGDKIMLSELTLPEGTRVQFRSDVPIATCIGRRGGLEAELEELEDEDAEGEEGEEGAEETAAE